MINQLEDELVYAYKETQYQKQLLTKEFNQNINSLLMVKEDLEAKIFNLKERINSQKDIIDKNLKEIYSLKSRIENQQSEIFEFNVK